MGLTVCTTGETSLGTTADAYTRTAGSFLSDGFAVGMEVTASGFATSASNGIARVIQVTPLRLRIDRALDAGPPTSGRIVRVGLPSSRAWENVSFAPCDGVPWVEEQFIPGPNFLATLGPNAEVESRPMYALRVHVPEGKGIGAARRYADAILGRFPMRSTIAAGDVILRVRSDTGPYVGQLQRSQAGFVVVPVTIPLRMRTVNTI
jgi:hypothetical protein